MREIKFRAWDNQDNKMITNGCLGAGSGSQLIVIEWNGGLSLCNAYGLYDGTNPTFDKPVTERFDLMQYTGLKDKAGKEIYEGDIVLRTDEQATIFFNSSMAAFDFELPGGDCEPMVLTDGWHPEAHTVIGTSTNTPTY